MVGKSEGKKSLGRVRLRWDEHIKMDFREMECGVRIEKMEFRIPTSGGFL
jgi:hypothetical protein